MNLKIREWRMHRGLTQRELSRLSGVGVGTIVNAERCYRKTSSSTLRAIAFGLGIEPEAFNMSPPGTTGTEGEVHASDDGDPGAPS